MSELILKLGIDWKLLIAQGVNFAVLLYILQRFVFKPLMISLNSRQKQIEKNVSKGDEVEAKLREAENLKEEILKKARQDSEKILKSAEKSALKLKDEKIAETHVEVEKMIAHGKATIENDRATLRADLKKEMGQLLSHAVEKTIGDVIDTAAQKKLVEEAHSIIKHTHTKA